MQKYQKTYLKGIGFDFDDPDAIKNIKSEISGERADDIHHIKYLMKLQSRQDYPFERLIALTRSEHDKFGDKKQYFDYLLWIHYLYHDYDFDDKYLPDSVFDWSNSTGADAHMNMFHFYSNVMARKYYVEIWEYPDHCLMQVYNQMGNLIKEFRKETKFEIFARSINIPRPVVL